MAIGATVHKLVLDTSKHTAGAKEARAQNRAVAQSMREIETPAEKASKRLDHLANAHREGKITADKYARAVENEKAKLDAATGATDGFASKLTKANVAMLAAAGGAAVVATALAALRVVVDNVSEAFDKLGEQSQYARSLGVSVTELDRFSHAAGRAGIEAQEAGEVYRDLRVRIGEAATGSGEAAEQFAALGLNAQALAAMSPEEAMYAMADAFQAHADGAEEAAIADGLLGDAGVALLPILNQGSEGLRAMAEESDRLNGKLENWETRGVEEANKAIGDAQTAITALWRRLAVDLAPTVEIVADDIAELAVQTRQFLEAAKDAPLHIAGYAGALHDAYEIANALIGLDVGAALNTDLGFDRAEEYANAAAERMQAARDAAAAEPPVPAGGAEAARDDSAVKARMRAIQREIDLAEHGADAVAIAEARREGATEREIAMLEELQDIRRQQIADADKAAAAEKRREDAAQDAAKQRVESERRASQAIAAARKALADQEKADAKIRDDIAKGPGAGNEAGTNAAVAYMADMRNAEIAKQVMPAQPEVTEDQLAAEANRQLQQLNEESNEQTRLAQRLLKATEENRVRRVR